MTNGIHREDFRLWCIQRAGANGGGAGLQLAWAWQEAANAFKRVLIYADTLLNFGYAQQFRACRHPTKEEVGS